MAEPRTEVKTALISVFDKGGLGPLVTVLKDLGVQIYSTQGTAKYLNAEFGVDAKTVESLTQFPELMEGRVKTLHPRIYGGILARREESNDVAEADTHGIPLFDMVVCNLYPFWDHTHEDQNTQASFVDIGGPCMIRASAKNHRYVLPVSHPSDYKEVIEELQSQKGATRLEFRQEMAVRTFQRTSEYDSLIASNWKTEKATPSSLTLEPQEGLRYGENPHQWAVWTGSATWQKLQGKELSYNNLLDTESALRLVCEFEESAIVVVKHNNPCGVATHDDNQLNLWKRAFGADSQSAFGGIVAFNRKVEAPTAEEMANIFLEVIIAPSFSDEAKSILGKKKNLRVIEWKNPKGPEFEVRPALGGWLVQQADQAGVPDDLKTVTTATPSPKTLDDLKFAWMVCKHVRSNAIVLVRDGVTLGIGAGQMSRVDAVEIALRKANRQVEGAVLASDAFFPFRDNIDLLKGLGIQGIIQPGGSMRDGEVIEACNEQEIAMVVTGQRHFRH